MHTLTKNMIEEHGVTEFHCHCCEHKLNPKTMTWLELNSETGEWAIPGREPWSDSHVSQGCFAFGKACAKRILKEQKGLTQS